MDLKEANMFTILPLGAVSHEFSIHTCKQYERAFILVVKVPW
jgi:hypothetical protein